MLFAFALVVCLLVACQLRAQTHTREVPLQIELDAFSGRPNPNWRLTADQVVEFLKKFHALKAAPGVHSAPNNLGYRGFVVTANGETVGGYDELRVYHGLVFASRGDRTETFIDSEWSMPHRLMYLNRSCITFKVRFSAKETYIQGKTDSTTGSAGRVVQRPAAPSRTAVSKRSAVSL